jgi:uncharacterized protein (TIGR01777 family)
MRIAIGGASGLLGSAVALELERRGHDVVRLVRRAPAGGGEVRWDPQAGVLDADALGRPDALVSLSGATLDSRWTESRKREIVDSRVLTTRLLAETAAAIEPRPALVCSSAIGVYGHDGSRGEEVLTEESSPGTGFQADLVQAWEAAADPAREAGARVVHLRTAPVLTRRSGLLKRMLLPFKLGAGGRLGSGQQWWSWIEIDDVVAGYMYALESDLDGVANLTSPNPVRNAEFTKALGRAVNRPTILPTPTFAVQILLGREAAKAAALYGLRVLPKRLQERGFEFTHPEIDGALAAALAD